MKCHSFQHNHRVHRCVRRTLTQAFNSSVEVQNGCLHSLPVTKSHFHFLSIYDSLVFQNKSVPPLVPHSYPFSMCFTDRHHHHGWPFGHFRTLSAILWRAALSLRYRNITVSMDDEFSLEDAYLAHTNGNALRTSAQDYLSNVRNCISSTSSSPGTTAPCGLWPVEQHPSIFSHLSPTLHHR
jgi:hypothetical protein